MSNWTISKLALKLRAFRRARNANVAMMFGLALVPIMIAAGAGLDMARSMMARSAMSEALDAAALAVGATQNSQTLTASQAQNLAQQYFMANYKAGNGYGAYPTLGTPIIGNQSVTLTASQQVPTTLLAVGGIHSLNISTSSTVVWGQTKLWVTLVLDNTGSMTETDSSGTSKISALKTAATQLLTILQGASHTVGDVQAAIVPFSKDVNVGTGYVNAAWIDWTDWESQPPNVTVSSSNDSSTVNGNVGPGSACPFTTSTNRQKSPYGYYCTSGPGNSASNTSTIPSSGSYKGMICPGVDSGNYNSGRMGRYYNGCYNSTPTQTATTTKTQSTPTTVKYNCTSVNSGAPSCSQSSSSTGSTTTNTSTATTAGYNGDSGPTTTNSSSSSTSDGSQSCSTRRGTTTCTWTRTIVTTNIATTVTAVGAAPYSHQWVVNDHSTWSGCLMDRTQNYDTTADSPSALLGSLFPAENAQSCVPSIVTPLPQTWTAAQWTTLSNQINAMTANGSTNQTIGLDHGMMTQTGNTSPYDPPPLPANTTRYIILVSDGLNTQDRWYGDGSNQSTSVDNRMAATCTNAKSAGFVIYTIFVDLGGTQGNSSVLQNCASDSSKYFDLTTSSALITTFNTIGQQITALRVAR